MIDSKIGEKTKLHIDENQREYYLKEQMRAISDELYGDDSLGEAEDYYERIAKLNAPDEVKEKLNEEVVRLTKMPYNSQEASVIRGYLDTCLALPWNVKTEEKIDIAKARKVAVNDYANSVSLISINKIND